MMLFPVAPPGATMAISFQSDEEVLRKLREQLRKMSDAELINLGEMCGDLRRIRFSGNWKKLGESGKGESRLEQRGWRLVGPAARINRE